MPQLGRVTGPKFHVLYHFFKQELIVVRSKKTKGDIKELANSNNAINKLITNILCKGERFFPSEKKAHGSFGKFHSFVIKKEVLKNHIKFLYVFSVVSVKIILFIILAFGNLRC